MINMTSGWKCDSSFDLENFFSDSACSSQVVQQVHAELWSQWRSSCGLSSLDMNWGEYMIRYSDQSTLLFIKFMSRVLHYIVSTSLSRHFIKMIRKYKIFKKSYWAGFDSIISGYLEIFFINFLNLLSSDPC